LLLRGKSNEFDKGSMIAVDSKGMLYLAGSFVYDIDADPGQNTAMLTNSGQEDMYVACYDGSKTPANNSFYRWAFKIEHSSSNNILATNDGSVYVTGLTNDEQDLDPGSNVHATKGNFVAKYDGTKSIDNTNFFKWSFQVPDGAQVENYFIDSKNALYLTGQILRGYDCDFDPSINNDTLKVTNSNNDYFLLAKYDLTKNPDDTTFYQWAFDIGGESYFGDNFIGKDIAVGKLVLSKNIEIRAGNSVQHIYTTALERGLYFVRITTPGQRIFLRFIK